MIPDADKAISFIHHVIERLCARGNIIIVGRGSQSILATKPNTFHVRFIASLDDRINEVMAGEGIIHPKALKKVQTIDKQRAHYLKRYYDVDWADAGLYDLVLNTSLMSIEQAVKVITSAVRHLETEIVEGVDYLNLDIPPGNGESVYYY